MREYSGLATYTRFRGSEAAFCVAYRTIEPRILFSIGCSELGKDMDQRTKGANSSPLGRKQLHRVFPPMHSTYDVTYDVTIVHHFVWFSWYRLHATHHVASLEIVHVYVLMEQTVKILNLGGYSNIKQVHCLRRILNCTAMKPLFHLGMTLVGCFWKCLVQVANPARRKQLVVLQHKTLATYLFKGHPCQHSLFTCRAV